MCFLCLIGYMQWDYFDPFELSFYPLTKTLLLECVSCIVILWLYMLKFDG